MIETIEFNGQVYPKLQSEGFAAQWAFPFAKKLCSGVGFDIGCNRVQWCLPSAYPIDPLLEVVHEEQNKFDRKGIYDAYNLPLLMPSYYATLMGNVAVSETMKDISEVDYIFSSHCLEHLPDWIAALDYWVTRLKPGGQLFLYLPNMDEQHYWKPFNNRKHLHYINPAIIEDYFIHRPNLWCEVMVTKGYDLNASFYAIANKK